MSKKKAIIANATKLFSEKGFRQTSMSELAAITGLASGTIFYHFNTKEELFLSILENIKDGIVDEFTAYIDGNEFENGLQMILGAVGFYLEHAGRMTDQFRLLHRQHTHELASTHPECRNYLEAIYDCFIDLFSQAIIRGQKDGSIGDLPARKTALIIFALVDGLVRFNTYNLYNAATLYSEAIESCRRILLNG
jgi:AcrR family transcriptional regulator